MAKKSACVDSRFAKVLVKSALHLKETDDDFQNHTSTSAADRGSSTLQYKHVTNTTLVVSFIVK